MRFTRHSMRHAHCCLLSMLLLCGAASVAQAQALVQWVTTTQPTGPGSLTAAIAALQPANPVWQEIRFALPAGSGNTITLTAPLPALVGVNVRITGEDHAAGVVIDGGLQPMFLVESSSSLGQLSLHALHLRRGSRTGRGGCLEVRYWNTRTMLADMHFEDCQAQVGATAAASGGAVNVNGPLQVTRSRFVGNRVLSASDATMTAQGRGGAISVSAVREVDIEASVFRDNRVHLVNALTPTCTGGPGGAIALSVSGGAQVTVRDSIFSGNYTACRRHPLVQTDAAWPTGDDLFGMGDGGAISVHGSADHRFEGNFFDGNHGGRGGAIAADHATGSLLTLVNNTFRNNRARLEGGGIAVINCCQITLDHNTFSGNLRDQPGDHGSQLSLGGSTILAQRYNVFDGHTPSCSIIASAGVQQVAHNAYSDAGCGNTGETGSLYKLGAMDFFVPGVYAGNGLPTLRPLPGSPVVDAGPSGGVCPVGHDAGGTVRPHDGNGDGVAACDIGAHERVHDELFDHDFECRYGAPGC